MAGLYAFKLKDHEAFPSHMFGSSITSSMTPDKWWKIMDMKQEKARERKLPSGFCAFIASLQSCPASSGSIERVFSSFGLVWTKIRNSLGKDRAQKLVAIYRHLANETESGESEW